MVATDSRTHLLFKKFAHLLEFFLDSIHLLSVLGPDFTSLQSLTLSHLGCMNDLVHEVAEQPHTNEAQGYDQDQGGSQIRNPEEGLQLVACRDDEKGEVHDHEKRLPQIETVFLCEEELAPSGKSGSQTRMWIECTLFHPILLDVGLTVPGDSSITPVFPRSTEFLSVLFCLLSSQ